jgi:O-antigen ligase
MTRLTLWLDRLAAGGALAALLCAPTQWSIELLPKLHVCPADLLLALAAAVWLAALLLRRDWACLRPLPWPHLLFFCLAAASLAVAHDRMAAIREIIQTGLYFVAGSVLAADLLRRRPHADRLLMIALLAPAALVLVLACIQYFGPNSKSLTVRGAFGNRNVLGGYLALVLPLAFSLLLTTPSWLLRLGLSLLLVAGLTVNLAGASFYAIAGTITLLAAVRGWRTFAVVAGVLILWQTEVLPRLPRENDLTLFRSTALYAADGQPERRYPEWQAAANLILERPWMGAGAGNYQRTIGPYFDTIPNATGPAEPDIQNLYLVLAGSMGLPALLVFGCLLGTAIVAGFRAATTTDGWHQGAAAGAACGLLAFACTAVWHPLLVRGLGLPLVAVLALARARQAAPPTVLTPTE